MKRITAFILVIFSFIFLLFGCKGADIYYEGKYDSEKYALNEDIDGVRFLIPAGYNNMKQTQEQINSELEKMTDNNEKVQFINSRVTYKTNGTDYQILKPNEFYLYVLNLEGLKNTKDYDDVTTLAKKLGVEKFMSFEKDTVDKQDMVSKNGLSRNIFNAKINDLTMQSVYYGHISIIEDSEEGQVYAIVVGFGDKSHYNTSREIAQNFFLNK